jgi:hypothetical protein
MRSGYEGQRISSTLARQRGGSPNESIFAGLIWWNPTINALREWIEAAGAARQTCQNKPDFDLLIDHQKRRLAELEGPSRGSEQRRRVTIPIADRGRHVSNYAVGFGRFIVQDKSERAVAAGSGTLVKVGSVHGILTAAHVFREDNLPAGEEVALILSSESPSRARRMALRIQRGDTLVFDGKDDTGLVGPDLGFLRIFPPLPGSLEALGCTFYNLKKWADDVLLDKAPAKDSVDSVIGIVAERARIVAGKGKPTETIFEMHFCGGSSDPTRLVTDYDLIDFQATNDLDPDYNLPSDYRGTSGGALWRFYFVMEGEEPTIVTGRLIGVPFRQSDATADGKRVLTCHGPKSIYSKLVAAIETRWPEEASSS